MKRINYIVAAVAVVAAAASCNKTGEDISAAGKEDIAFAPASVQTKALLTTETLTDQTFQVRDILDGADYVTNTIQYTDDSWQYVTEAKYPWKNGSHKLFGWLDDADAVYNNGIITVSKELTTAAQTDFIYSDLVATTAAAWKTAHAGNKEAAVPLHFNHLFAALNVSLQNLTAGTISVKSVTVAGLKNSGSATLTYTGESEVAVAYGTISEGAAYVTGTALADASLASEAVLDVLGQTVATPEDFLIWPQTSDGNFKITVTYTLDGSDKEIENTVTIPADQEWEAGTKYFYLLTIRGKDIELTVEAAPWDLTEINYTSAKNSLNMSNVTWVNRVVDGENTVNNTNRSVTIHTGEDFSAYTGESTWGVVGKIASRGDNWDLEDPAVDDLAMLSSGNVHVAKGITLSTEDEFKFRAEKDWSKGQVGAPAGYSEPYILTVGTTVTGTEGGSNFKVPADGVYDLKLDTATGQVTAYAGTVNAQGYFTITYPTEGSWAITLEGDTDYFEVSPASGAISAGTITNFLVKPTTKALTENHGEVKVRIHMTVTSTLSGAERTYNADTEVRANYDIIIPANN